jgi:hypothetical protein
MEFIINTKFIAQFDSFIDLAITKKGLDKLPKNESLIFIDTKGNVLNGHLDYIAARFNNQFPVRCFAVKKAVETI